MNDPQSLLAAAQGYFALAMYQAAYDELDELPAAFKTSEEVLALRVCILHKLESWILAREVAAFLREAAPENSQYVIWEAYATRRASGLEAARAVLLSAREAHTNEPIVFSTWLAIIRNLEIWRKRKSILPAPSRLMGTLGRWLLMIPT